MFRLTQLVILIGLCNHVCCYNILAIVSMPLKTHYLAFGDLFRELATRGHSVTVINNFPEETPVPNLQFIQLAQPNSTRVHKYTRLDVYEKYYSWTLPYVNLYGHIRDSYEFISKDCDNLFNDASIPSIKGIKYDVIFVEFFMSDCALAFAGAVFDAPIIGIASHVPLPWAYPRLGLPFNAAADPFYFTAGGPNPSFVHKIEAFVGHNIFNSLGRWCAQKAVYEKFLEHLPNYNLNIEKIATDRIKMSFSYQHFSFAGARVLSPQVLEIAGLHVKKPKALPKDIETFLNEAEHGAIYVGVGSNLKLSTMSEKKMGEFLQAFKRISPLKVLLKWEDGAINEENVLTKSWFPQQDVLCHSKVIAFVSHGGMLGTSEAASCGVPMVVMPFFADQFGNAAMIQASGMGMVLNFGEVTGETLANAIKVITSDAMQKRAKEISELWHDRPMSAMDSAIYWTEYVARHPNATTSLPTKHIVSWFEYQLIDVYATLLALLAMLLLVIYLMLKLLLKLVKVLFMFVFSKVISSKEKVA